MAVLLAVSRMKVLIAENDPSLVKDIALFLKGRGISCETPASLEEAMASLASHYYDAVTLQLSTLGRTEIQLLRFLKTAGLDKRTVLTYERAVVSPAQMDALGMQNLQKPYTFEALLNKIAAVCNFQNIENNQVFHFNELVVDVPGRAVKVKDQEIDLTRTEFDLLHLLLLNRTQIVSKTELAQYLAGKKTALQSGTLHAHIKNLKKKLRLAGCSYYIKTVYGIGYRLER